MGISLAQALEIQVRLDRNRKRHHDPAAVENQGADRESKLHEQILTDCRRRGWIVFHGSMAHRVMRTLGEPDFTIVADGGRFYFIEAKSRVGKLTREQLGLQMMAEKLGHKIWVCRSFQEFLAIVDGGPTTPISL